ncbi:unnamed protein product [Closterium sp. Yama58-4]|nr:unnamed protein product [Closterium sp. Yama58-4]
MWRGQQGETAKGPLKGTQWEDTTWSDQWAEQHSGSSSAARVCDRTGEAGIAILCEERPAGDELIIVLLKYSRSSSDWNSRQKMKTTYARAAAYRIEKHSPHTPLPLSLSQPLPLLPGLVLCVPPPATHLLVRPTSPWDPPTSPTPCVGQAQS